MLATSDTPTVQDLFAASQFEVKERRFLVSVLKPGDFFIDCGANELLYTRLAAPIVGYTGLVLAIDPFIHAKPCYEIAANVRYIPQAVGATVGMVEFDVYGPPHTAWNNAVGMKMEVPPQSKAMIPMTRLSALVEVFGEGRRVDYLKLDTEGHERDILRDIFGRGIFPRYIQFESAAAAMTVQKPCEIVDELHAYGYGVYAINNDGNACERVHKVDAFYDNFVAMRDGA